MLSRKWFWTITLVLLTQCSTVSVDEVLSSQEESSTKSSSSLENTLDKLSYSEQSSVSSSESLDQETLSSDVDAVSESGNESSSELEDESSLNEGVSSSEEQPSSGISVIENVCNPNELCDVDLSYPSYTPTGDEIVISRTQYLDRLHGFWLAECLANWTGLRTEFDRSDFPFYTRNDWGTGDIDWVITYEGSPWGSDDDTDIEYTYQHLLDVNNTSMLTGEQIRDGWLTHMWEDEQNFLWVSNQKAFTLMLGGMTPPETSEPHNNSGFASIDAQLTTEIFGLFAPARPDKAIEMAHLPIRVSAKENAEWISEFYVIMHSLSAYVDSSWSMKDKVFWLAAQARQNFPEGSYPADMYDFVKELYDADQDNWEYARDEICWKYQKEGRAGYVYGEFFLDWGSNNGSIDAGMNFASSMVSLFYGEGDIQNTLKIAALTGWDSDNPTATWGGLLGSMLGKEGVEQAFGITNFSDTYWIHRTRRGFPDHTPGIDGEDTFPLMAERGVYIVDRAVQELMGGGVDLENDLWYIPDNGGAF